MTTDKDLPPKPARCSCGGPITLLQVKVQHVRTGRYQVGPFSEFSVTGPRGGRTLKSDYRFFKWIGECSECFYKTNQEEMFG